MEPDDNSLIIDPKVEAKLRAWRLYASGWQVSDIAREFQLSEQSIRNWIMETGIELRNERLALAAGYIDRELEGLAAFERMLSERMAADPASRLECIAAALKIKERRARYLALDKPIEVKHTASLEDLVTGAGAVAISAERGGTPGIDAAHPTPPPTPEIFSPKISTLVPPAETLDPL
jgi:hypothetical protein